MLDYELRMLQTAVFADSFLFVIRLPNILFTAKRALGSRITNCFVYEYANEKIWIVNAASEIFPAK